MSQEIAQQRKNDADYVVRHYQQTVATLGNGVAIPCVDYIVNGMATVLGKVV